MNVGVTLPRIVRAVALPKSFPVVTDAGTNSPHAFDKSAGMVDALEVASGVCNGVDIAALKAAVRTLLPPPMCGPTIV
jgi:hypothetical protein